MHTARTVAYAALLDTVQRLFEGWGFAPPEALDIAQALVAADLSGISSHGIQRLGLYEDIIARGIVQVRAEPCVVRQTPATAVVDARRAMGQLAALFCMRLAMQMARQSGVGVVAVRASNHFGTAGYYAQLAAREGLLGVCMTNTCAAMPATFGVVPLLGTNPVAFAFPGEPFDFLYDASSTVVSLGKIEVYAKAGKPLPAPWGLDAEGEPTTDPDAVLRDIYRRPIAGVLPLGGAGETTGGHKGYGQGMMVEILTAILAGGLTSDEITAGPGDGACHFFAALDPALFGDPAAMRAHLAAYFDRLRASNLTDPAQRVYIHGEKEFETREKYLREGIPIQTAIWDEFQALCARNGIH
ncbi:MAG: Ldh family oxidoreductase [Oscillospiraceae bacterium]|jgi:LDH2 family malate/lactate/ureidoglycolate dehydrogenase|nr:Ldh family oxidoreductase [Oscillospiraceae bacterium]